MTSLGQCIITDKDSNFIKNWCPISLLSVIYKMASDSIAERLKQSLENVISESQTGFIKGRFIGNSTRQVGKLVVACHWWAVYSTEPLRTVCTDFLCPSNYPS